MPVDILELGKFFSGSKNSTASNADGFVADCYRLDELQNVGWDKYAESLLARLEKTNTGKKSFTVSLTGSWGTGKTTFLSYLKEDMHRKGLNFLDFNPWLSSSTETIIQDFFHTFNGCKFVASAFNTERNDCATADTA